MPDNAAMKNIFFDRALALAGGLLGNKKRLLLLITRLGWKLKDVNWKEVRTSDVRQKFSVVGRLVKAYGLGKYREIPWRSLLLITGVIIYFIMPIDVIPDLIPGLGLTDDFGILLAVYKSLEGEVDKFLTWEKSQVTE
jgi:uncharacterized membrane protein YkvA (DUF1232 family)